jgi:hypothetical protein
MERRASVADLVYRSLLHLYPARFHEEFASDMALDFADASDEAWLARRWRGLTDVWMRTALDLSWSLTAQWIRTRAPLFALVGFVIALAAGSATFALAAQGPPLAAVKPADRDLVALLIIISALFLVIASTIILTLCFIKPMLQRATSRIAPKRRPLGP